MKSPIAQAIHEVLFVVRTTAFLQAIMDSLPFFLGVALVLILVRINWFYALIPWVLYLAWHAFRLLRSANLLYVEKKNPLLYESLRTAADTSSKENVVIAALHHEVLVRLKTVFTSDFVKFRKMTRQILLCAFFSFAILFASLNGYKLFDAADVWHEVQQLHLPGYYPNATLLVPPEPQNDSLIYGKKSIIELGTKELQLQLTPLKSDLDVSKQKPPEAHTFKEALPTFISATQESSFSERIPKEHQQIVKEYFTQITKG